MSLCTAAGVCKCLLDICVSRYLACSPNETYAGGWGGWGTNPTGAGVCNHLGPGPSCSALNTARTCSTFGKACVGLDACGRESTRAEPRSSGVGTDGTQ